MKKESITENRQKIIAFLEKDFDEDTRKQIFPQIEQSLKEIEGAGFSKEDLKAMRACYEAELNDSMGSAGVILTVGCFVLALVQLLNVPNDAHGLTEVIFSAIAIAVAGLYTVFGMHILGKMSKISGETAKLRNRVIAVNILLREMEEDG